MPLFRRSGEPPQRADVLYVHLTRDGAIFVVRGDGTQAWITRARLHEELRALKSAGGTLLYSRDDPAADPSPATFELFKGMADYELPIKLVDEPHPDVANPLPDEATMLMAFADRGEETLAEDLLARGAVVDARDVDGYTALMYAANRGSDGCARLLLAHGANANAADKDGSTPLMFAAQGGHASIVKRLLDGGADPTSRGDHGFTALDFAEQNGHTATMNVLTRAERSR